MAVSLRFLTGSVPHAVLAPRSGGLLGRDAELLGVAAAVKVSRLVSLTGAPGIGKTRLALAVADRHAAPAVVVELASVAHPALVPAALASALSVREVPGQGLIETVVATLRGQSLLLVLDNCEHLLEACAEVVDRLIAGCPGVRVLATSREPFRLEGDRVWPVPPLLVPEHGHDADSEELMAYPAVALFVERAGEVQAGFALNAFVAADVAKICRGLDGIPLAIELAAARVDMLTPGEISRRLGDPVSLLSARARSSIPRHQTLELALDWSHELLTAPERALLRRLSVFTGRFGFEAAAAICVDRQVDPPGVSGLLARLVAKSLLVAETGADGTVRHRLLETIRGYAGERLEWAGEVADLRSAHARFYLMLVERAEPELTGPRQADWFERLEAERANLRAALEWSLGSGKSEWALRLAGALVLFWRVRCHFTEGRELLRAALTASDEPAPALKAKALWGAGFMALMAGDEESAVPWLEQSLACYRGLGDPQGCARALLILANARLTGGQDTRVVLEESASLAREAGDSWCLAHALGVAGFERAYRHERHRARELFEEGIAVAREAGDLQGLRFGLIGLGQFAVDQADYGLAESMLEEGVQVSGALGEDYDKSAALQYLGVLAFGRGEYPRARKLLDEALALSPDVGPHGHRLVSLFLLARVARAQGDLSGARRMLEEGMAIGSVGAPVLQALGELAIDEGDRDEGRRLLEEARDLARARGDHESVAEALHGLGELARTEEDLERAAALHHHALALRREFGEPPAIADSLEALGGLAAVAGDSRRAARLFGAATAVRERGGYARAPWNASRYDADVTAVRESLPPSELASALTEGQSLSLEEAMAEAATGPRPTRRARPSASLTKREKQVAELVAAGLTNPEIAERLVITRGTVKTHVSHIFSKLGVTARWELARAVRSANGVRS